MIKHLQFLFASIMILAFGINASAQEVVFDFTPKDSYKLLGLTGTSNKGKAGNITETKTLTIDDVTFTITPSKKNTANRFWLSGDKNELRTYGGSFTISSTKNITKIAIETGSCDVSTTVGTFDSKKRIWTATENTNSVEFKINAKTEIRKINVTLADNGGNVDPTPTPGETKELYSVIFDTQDNVNTWTLEGPVKDLLYFNSGKKFVSLNHGQINFSETYFVSPKITLESNNTVSFDNTQNGYLNDDASLGISLVVRTTDGAAWEKIEGEIKYGTNLNEFVNSGEIAVPAKYNGKEVQFAFECKFSQAEQGSGSFYLKNFTVKGSKASTPDPEPVETIANNIAEYKALCTEAGVNVTLKLKDAKVLYVNEYKTSQNVYVRDETGAILLYNLGLEVKDGDVINGSVKSSAKIFNDMHEVCKSKDTDVTTLTITEGELATATPKKIVEVTNEDISDLIVIDNIDVISEVNDKFTDYFVTDSEGNKLLYYNKYHIAGLDGKDVDGKKTMTVVGIVNIFKGKVQICPIAEMVATGIDCIENVELDVNAPMYNVAGQKVNANYKGIVLQNGKKFINK